MPPPVLPHGLPLFYGIQSEPIKLIYWPHDNSFAQSRGLYKACKLLIIRGVCLCGCSELLEVCKTK